PAGRPQPTRPLDPRRIPRSLVAGRARREPALGGAEGPPPRASRRARALTIAVPQETGAPCAGRAVVVLRHITTRAGALLPARGQEKGQPARLKLRGGARRRRTLGGAARATALRRMHARGGRPLLRTPGSPAVRRPPT